MGPRAGLEEYGKSRPPPTGIRSPDCSWTARKKKESRMFEDPCLPVRGDVLLGWWFFSAFQRILMPSSLRVVDCLTLER